MSTVIPMADTQSECSHTPEPWELDWQPVPGRSVHAEFPYLHYVRIQSANYYDVAPNGLSVTGYMRKADALLIASAPDLYATLNDVLDSFDRQTMEEMLRKDNDAHDDDEFCVNLTAKQLRAINQAILKAEGKV